MKKLFMLALAVTLCAVPAVQAQKVNKEAIIAKIKKSDADIADAKKNTKAATWMNRGKVMYEAAVAPTKDIFVGMDAPMLELTVGKPKEAAVVEIGGKQYDAQVYNYFVAYLQMGKVATWTQTMAVYPPAVQLAIEAYNKAYELDPKLAPKVKEGLTQIIDFCKQAGNTGLDTNKWADAADNFLAAFQAGENPAIGGGETMLLYYAGYLRTVDSATNPDSFAKGAEYLQGALERGYNDEKGDIYYYLYHCLYGMKNANPENVAKAKDALMTGLEKFPSNENIVTGLVELYASEPSLGNPENLIEKVDETLAVNPENVGLWFGRGRIFYALKKYDESINSFKKVVELRPDIYEGHYYLGVFYTIKGDEANQELNNRSYMSQAAYDADLAEVNKIYAEALPYFEKAHEMRPDNVDALEFLKSLCFRLRDMSPEIMDKYTKYNKLWKEAKGE